MMYRMILIFSLLMLLSALNSEQVQDFTLPDINNNNVNISDYLGDSIIVLDFWASWCAPCMRLLPELEKIHQEYDEVTVITVSIDNPRSVNRAKSLLRSQRYTFISLFDTNQDVMSRFQVTTVPHTYLIDLEGEIVYDHTGYTRGDEDELIRKIEEQIALMEREVEETITETEEESE